LTAPPYRASSSTGSEDKSGSIFFGYFFVRDKSVVPNPAAGITAFFNTLE
jgi:hypothetical protein